MSEEQVTAFNVQSKDRAINSIFQVKFYLDSLTFYLPILFQWVYEDLAWGMSVYIWLEEALEMLIMSSKGPLYLINVCW